MVMFAFFATVLNYIHRLSFNYLSADGELRELIPNEAFGYIGMAFFIAYMISNAFSGFVIDKLGTRLGYSLCMAFWTTAALLHAFVITPFQFGIVRFLLGLGEAGNWPAAIKLISEWFPPQERSTASGIFNSGSALGAVIAPPLIAYLGIHFGWQSAFMILGAVGYLWLALFWFNYYTPDTGEKEAGAKSLIPLKVLFKTRFLRMFTLSKFFLDPIWYFITFWIGRYLVDVHGWNMAQIGWFAAIPFLIADVGNLLGGYFTQFIIKKGVPIPKARKIAVGIAGLIMCLPLLSAPWIVESPMGALIIFGISGFGYTMYTANALAFPADVGPRNATATLWGLACVGTGLGGALFQALSGIALEKYTAIYDFEMAYNVLFVGYGLAGCVGLVITIFFLGPLKPNPTLHQYST